MQRSYLICINVNQKIYTFITKIKNFLWKIILNTTNSGKYVCFSISNSYNSVKLTICDNLINYQNEFKKYIFKFLLQPYEIWKGKTMYWHAKLLSNFPIPISLRFYCVGNNKVSLLFLWNLLLLLDSLSCSQILHHFSWIGLRNQKKHVRKLFK